jgi:transcriptional regulator GlxA family with amidase domain
MNCGILLFDGVDLMDVAGPYEVLLTASRLQERRGDLPSFTVTTVSTTGGPVTAYGGLGLAAESGPDGAGGFDVLIVPGAIAIDPLVDDQGLIHAVRRLAATAKLRASVCTGAFLLERAGLLDGVQATTHWEDVDGLAARLGWDRVRADVRWVDSGRVVTAGGLSSGIAMALHLVERFAGRELAEATARQVDYVWTEDRGA